MPAGPSHRIQTTKQAKAEFKARGGSHVTATQQRQIARGAELLERAERIRALEEKKKKWSKQKDEQQQKAKRDAPLLSSQRKLDRFGYASSQFHLGKFFAPKVDKQETAQEAEQQYNDHDNDTDDNDENYDPASPVPDPSSPNPSSSPAKLAVTPTAAPTTSPIDLSAFLADSSQLARDLSLSPTLPRHVVSAAVPASTKPPLLSISFSSEDGLFDDSTILALDSVIDAELRRGSEKSASTASEPPLTPTRVGSMLPPALPGSKQATTGPAKDLSVYGISTADLEWAVSHDIRASQFD